MVSKEHTVEVPSDTFPNVPEWYDRDTVPVDVTAFADKVYLDAPDFGAVERQIDRTVESDNKLAWGDHEMTVAEIQDRDEAIPYLKEAEHKMGSDGLPSRTTQFCASAMSIFRAFVRVDDSRDVTVTPKMRYYGMLRDNAYNPSGVRRRSINVDDADTMHLRLVEVFCETTRGVLDDDYWDGYRNGAGANGNYMSDADLLWTAFADSWDGDTDLMLKTGRWLARNGWAVCRRNNAVFPVPEWSTPTGSYVATICNAIGGECPECGADKDDSWECIKSSNRTRVPNKYKCTACGHKQKGITTG